MLKSKQISVQTTQDEHQLLSELTPRFAFATNVKKLMQNALQSSIGEGAVNGEREDGKKGEEE